MSRVTAMSVAAVSLALIGMTPPAPRMLPRPLCSFEPITGARDSSLTHLVATTLADTILAERGSVKPSRYGGHWGPGRKRAVYGQLVRVDTLGGADAALVRAELVRLRSRDVVVVPWDYDPGCEPTYWNESARWIAPGLAGFYKVKLRARKHWAGARPTFDAFTADLQPYPHGVFFREGYRGTDALRLRPSLDAHEMFRFYEVLPVWNQAELDAVSLQPLERWARDNSDLARKYPADEILAEYRRVRRAP